MISVGSIVKAEAARQFQELGTDILNVRLRARDRETGRISVKLSDAEGVAALPAIHRAAPFTIASSSAVVVGTQSSRARVIGSTDALASLGRLKLQQGRFVSRLDGGQHFCTLGAQIADTLRRATGGSVIGRTVRIGNTVFTVIGALSRVATGMRPFDANEAVFIPIETAARITPGATLRDILAQMRPQTHFRQAARELGAYFSARAPAAEVQVRSAEELIEQMGRQMRLYTLLLGAIGGIALLLGGIGTMNVMLVAVAERRREIGVRRAVGARRRDIQAQFLAESIVLSSLGGGGGVVLGFGATYGICHFAGWEFGLAWGGTALGIAVASGAGVIFGLYPAWQAANLDPAIALQGG